MTKKRIELVLKENMNKVGSAGDKISVSVGYARNYLLPNGLAEHITQNKINYINKIEKNKILLREQRYQEAIKLQKQLESIKKFTLKRKVSSDTQLFGSITDKDITDAVRNTTGLQIDKAITTIELPSIKLLGTYDIAIKILPDLKAQIKLQILPEII
uniref:Large ribosomal subunit protein bL9c n=1 Tax=Yamadaella caenomyce TaxID=259029 RepID=A0A1G4NYW7_9FLOR|nr:Ribosomal protein L9 [Yamadaella caenomyce]SCW23880.1 Ribosomal protein L9 [Yamadaella caenomyce]